MSPIVKHEFQLPSGEIAVRATSKDIPTFNRRVFGRIGKILGDEIANKTVIPGLNAYNSGQYKEARDFFEQAIAMVSAIAEELYSHLTICRRVLSIEKDYEDGIYEGELDRWQQSLFRWFLAKPISKIQCKYCGHYARYIHPMKESDSVGKNNCDRCGRGYPIPDFIWDSLDGQAYIYYGRSVQEGEFYREFEELFDVERPYWRKAT